MTLFLQLLFIAALTFLALSKEFHHDKAGYVMYCPCMGRFGNQADHLLGSLAFAKKLNRTLIVPPWISHDYKTQYKNSFLPFNLWFKTEALSSYHRVIAMEDFIDALASTVWPPSERRVYCYEAAMSRSNDKKSCPAKDGNPFGPFWNNFDIDFSASVVIPSRLRFESSKNDWDKTFPPFQNHVLTFMGAPAGYPVSEKNRKLQKYIEWSDEVNTFSSNFINSNLPRPYVGIHLRNGVDWKRACDHIDDGGVTYAFMSSPQCIGHGHESKKFTKEMCYPSREDVLQQTLNVIRNNEANSLFIATDNDDYKRDFKKKFEKAGLSVNVVRLNYDSLHKDLALLIESDVFLGSCGSSVTAFVVRKRNILSKPNFFFGLTEKGGKSEL